MGHLLGATEWKNKKSSPRRTSFEPWAERKPLLSHVLRG